jgi:hypothetical protein
VLRFGRPEVFGFGRGNICYIVLYCWVTLTSDSLGCFCWGVFLQADCARSCLGFGGLFVFVLSVFSFEEMCVWGVDLCAVRGCWVVQARSRSRTGE